jgi:hypothetical protein
MSLRGGEVVFGWCDCCVRFDFTSVLCLRGPIIYDLAVHDRASISPDSGVGRARIKVKGNETTVGMYCSRTRPDYLIGLQIFCATGVLLSERKKGRSVQLLSSAFALFNFCWG